MKTRHLPLATVIAGALGVAYAGCATQSELNPPDGTNGGGAFSASGGSTSGHMGGASGGPPMAYYAGAPPATYAGAPGASGAHSAAGAFGSSAGAPVISGAAGSAAAGAPAAIGGCVAAMGTIADLMIDNLEDMDNGILAAGNRKGFWYTYNDMSAVQVPSAAVFPPSPGGNAGSLFAAHTSGPAFTVWGAGLGFDFNNTAMKSCPYNASAYAGIKFWAKGNAPVKAMVKIPATTPASLTGGGTCVPTATLKCEDYHALKPSPTFTATWTQYTLDFASITTFGQEGWGIAAPFDKSNIIAMQFQVAMGVPFDFSIDDISFY